MGAHLAQPVTTKTINGQESRKNKLSFSSCEMQGWRRSMEDACISIVDLGDGNSLFGVFDGHGGNQVSIFVKENFENVLTKSKWYREKKYVESLCFTFEKIDMMIQSPEGEKRLKQINQEKLKFVESRKQSVSKTRRRSISSTISQNSSQVLEIPSKFIKKNASFPSTLPKKNSDYEQFSLAQEQKISYRAGCTANVILVTPQNYYIANAGDSRSVICRNRTAFSLSFDHKPQNSIEYERIINAGYSIERGRINGGLNLSRSLGDYDYKNVQNLPRNSQPVICTPEIRTVKRQKADEFILMGCDGIFQKYYYDEQPLIDLIRKAKKQKKSKTQILVRLFDQLLAKDTREHLGCDNMTAILIDFI